MGFSLSRSDCERFRFRLSDFLLLLLLGVRGGLGLSGFCGGGGGGWCLLRASVIVGGVMGEIFACRRCVVWVIRFFLGMRVGCLLQWEYLYLLLGLYFWSRCESE